MIINCGRHKFDVTEQDRVMYNGACYILITQSYFAEWSMQHPVVAKTTFNKLLKTKKVKLVPEKYLDRYDMYQFVVDADNGDQADGSCS